jgi:tRNA threonylcarbamoyladenosine biosynthesis protein TsaB
MLILAIDTSTRAGSVAFLQHRQVLAVVSGLEETPYANRLFRDIAVLQSRAQFTLDQIDIFAVAAGPGSFTGLRVGLTAVKAWAEVHRKPIAAISGLEAIAVQAKALQGQAPADGGIIAPFLDARRGHVFGAIYRRTISNSIQLERVGDEAILSVDEFLELAKGTASSIAPTLVSSTPDVLLPDRLHSILPGVQVERVSPVLAPVIGQLGFDRAGRGELVDPLLLDANYVRRTDAEAAWKDE